jgi:hypothetical protein
MPQPRQIREHGFLLSATLLPALEVAGVSQKKIRALASHVILLRPWLPDYHATFRRRTQVAVLMPDK